MTTTTASGAHDATFEELLKPSGARTRKLVIIVCTIVLVLGGAALLWARARTEAAPSIRFTTAEVTRGALQARVTATGTLSALVTVQVGSQVSGRIQEILVDYNSPVKKGQVIARIDPSLFQAAAEQARANYVAAQANLERARAQEVEANRSYARVRSLTAQHLMAQADLDVAESNARTAQAQVRASAAAVGQTRAARDQSETTLRYTTIGSPIDGIVISRNVDVGQTVAASFQSPTLFVIAEDLRRMQVDTNVAEADVGRLRVGITARFRVDAFPSKIFEGRVRQIRNAPQTIQNVVTYDAVIDVDNTALELKPGMTANVTFVYADRTNALLIPTAALRFRPPATFAQRAPSSTLQGDQRLVWVLTSPEAVKPEIVRVGVSDGATTEVTEGALAPGDRVATEATAPSGSRPGSFGRVF